MECQKNVEIISHEKFQEARKIAENLINLYNKTKQKTVKSSTFPSLTRKKSPIRALSCSSKQGHYLCFSIWPYKGKKVINKPSKNSRL